jgi:hypothetical protein
MLIELGLQSDEDIQLKNELEMLVERLKVSLTACDWFLSVLTRNVPRFPGIRHDALHVCLGIATNSDQDLNFLHDGCPKTPQVLEAFLF